MSLGIEPSESAEVLEEDFPLAEFLAGRRDFERKARLKMKLDIAEAVQIGVLGTKGRQGVNAFNAWLAYTQRALVNKPEKEQTVFEKMKAQNENGNVFDRLKRKKGA